VCVGDLTLAGLSLGGEAKASDSDNAYEDGEVQATLAARTQVRLMPFDPHCSIVMAPAKVLAVAVCRANVFFAQDTHPSSSNDSDDEVLRAHNTFRGASRSH